MSGWDTVESTGLLDDCNITIKSAEFNYDASYNSGEQLLMIFSGTSDHPDFPEFSQFFSIGKGWETNDHGRTVVGSANGFNSKSQYGLFLAKAVALAGDAITGRGTPDNAAVWEGLSFHVKRENVDYGDLGIKKVLLPNAFNGAEGKAEAPAPSAVAQEAGAVETPVATPPVAANGNGSNAVLLAKLKAVAMSADTHDGFIEQVLEKYPEVQSDSELFSAVVDPSGLYAEAR